MINILGSIVKTVIWGDLYGCSMSTRIFILIMDRIFKRAPTNYDRNVYGLDLDL